MTAPKRSLLTALEYEMTSRMERWASDSTGILIELPRFPKLCRESSRLEQMFDEGIAPPPPQQQRINALARLRRKESLSRREWSHVSWGLYDHCGKYGLPIDEQPLFDAILGHAEALVQSNTIPRKFWFGLLGSYFSHAAEEPEKHSNWVKLRQFLHTSLPVLLGSIKREKTWSHVLRRHADLLSPHAGVAAGDALFEGNAGIFDDMRKNLPIADASWLWRKIIIQHLQRLILASDDNFYTRIDSTLALISHHPLFVDNVLAALLTRYASGAKRQEPHEALKRFALEHWSNPQIRTAARWSVVDEDVRRMVQQWLAKADLEHFFNLLQGEGGVDQQRLRYWLRFVEQISYTRIVMGADAVHNQALDFRDFREANKGRFGHLSGGARSNNAFVMRIGNDYFVEFSGTGNACYVYEGDSLPFKLDSQELHVDKDMKDRRLDKRTGKENRIRHSSGWQSEADRYLAKIGIFPGNSTPRRQAQTPVWSPLPLDARRQTALGVSSARTPENDFKFSPPPPSLKKEWASPRPPPLTKKQGEALDDFTSAQEASSRRNPPPDQDIPVKAVRNHWVDLMPEATPKETGQRKAVLDAIRHRRSQETDLPDSTSSLSINESIDAARKIEEAIAAAIALAKNEGCVVQDHRSNGGAFWVLEKKSKWNMGQQLRALGFKFLANRGYWIK